MTDPRYDNTPDTDIKRYKVPVYDRETDDVKSYQTIEVECYVYHDIWGEECVRVFMPNVDDEYVREDLKNMIEEDFYGYYIDWYERYKGV